MLTDEDRYAARIARVTGLGGDGYYLCDVDGGEVPAYLSDQATSAYVGVGTVVTLLRVLGGYQIVSVNTGPEGSGGVILGPELIANGGFEYGPLDGPPDGWSATWDRTTGEPDPFSSSTDSPLSGTRVAVVTVTPGAWTPNICVTRRPARIDPATRYRMSAFCSATITFGTSVNASIELVTAATEAACIESPNDALTQVVASLADPGQAWPLLSGDVTTTTGHTWFRPVLRVAADAGADLVIRWDQASLSQRLT